MRLTTDQGPIALRADARVDDGKLMQLSATLPSQALGTDGQLAQGLGAILTLTTTGDRVAMRLTAVADKADLQGWNSVRAAAERDRRPALSGHQGATDRRPGDAGGPADR